MTKEPVSIPGLKKDSGEEPKWNSPSNATTSASQGRDLSPLSNFFSDKFPDLSGDSNGQMPDILNSVLDTAFGDEHFGDLCSKGRSSHSDDPSFLASDNSPGARSEPHGSHPSFAPFVDHHYHDSFLSPPQRLPQRTHSDAGHPVRPREAQNSMMMAEESRMIRRFANSETRARTGDSLRRGQDYRRSKTASSGWHNDIDGPTRMKSQFLTDFRAGRIHISTLYQLEMHMTEFATDQMGARFIQQRLAACPYKEQLYARSILVPKLKSLATDVFGNHIVQKLIETGDAAQRHDIFEQLQRDVLRCALQPYGCRVLQKALETLSIVDRNAFAEELQSHVIRCVEDQNGNHVIQKCIESLPPANVQFVIDAFRGQATRVSMHCYGCRVIQRVLEYCPHDQINELLDEIVVDFVRLAQDQYGNYVVQHVLRYGRESDKRNIVDAIANNLLKLASHKFSSNVVEKCMDLNVTPDARKLIVQAAFGDPNTNKPPIMQMVRDPYANYVIQRILDVSQTEIGDELTEEILTRLEKHLPALRKFTYGKHIAAALERLRRQLEERHV